MTSSSNLPTYSNLINTSSETIQPENNDQVAVSSATFATRESILNRLPAEVLVRIFLNLTAPKNFSQTCKTFNTITKDPILRAQYFLYRYGESLALYEAFINFRKVTTPIVFQVMMQKKVILPRYLIQMIDKEFHRKDVALLDRSFNSSYDPVTPGFLVSVLNMGFQLYGSNIDISGDDNRLFERYLYGIPQNIDGLNDLLAIYRYTPHKTTCSTPLQDLVYKVSKINMSLLDKLIENGLDMDYINDLVMEKVFRDSYATIETFQDFIQHGFKLTKSTIKKGLLIPLPLPLKFLRRNIEQAYLSELAQECMIDLLGPATRIFKSDSADNLLLSFDIPTETLDKAVLVQSGIPFPSTRSYLKSYPYSVWRWILRTFGPQHRYTKAVFNDALSRAVGDPELHSLHDVFIDAGVKFQPNHIKILACRLLHRDMTNNALHLMNCLRVQVLGTIRRPLPPPIETLEKWINALRLEIVDNGEWHTRMRTIQLEGGTLGGVFRIPRAPEDGVKFLQEAKDLLAELNRTFIALTEPIYDGIKRRNSTGSVFQSLPYGPPEDSKPKVTFSQVVEDRGGGSEDDNSAGNHDSEDGISHRGASENSYHRKSFAGRTSFEKRLMNSFTSLRGGGDSGSSSSSSRTTEEDGHHNGKVAIWKRRILAKFKLIFKKPA